MTVATQKRSRNAGWLIAAALVPVGAFFAVLVGLAVSGDSTGPQMFANDVFSGIGAVLLGVVESAPGIGLAVALLGPALMLTFLEESWPKTLALTVACAPISLGVWWLVTKGYYALAGWLF